MQAFVQGIYSFVYQLMAAVRSSINLTDYNTFLSKQIIYGDLINIGLTWNELLAYVSTWAIVIFFIIFVCKFIFKLIGMVRIW